MRFLFDIRFGAATRSLLALLTAALGACTALSSRQPADTDGDCTRLYARFDAAVATAEVRDAQSAAIRGFPYLRVNRLLADLRDEVADAPKFDAWVERLAQLGVQARVLEIANLSAAERGRLRAQHTVSGSLDKQLGDCADSLRRRDLIQPPQRDHLLANAHVPDDYSSAQRIAGVYALSAVPFSYGVRKMHSEMRALYARAPALLADSESVTYAAAGTETPFSSAQVAAILRRSADNALRIPEPSAEQREQLFAAFAPVISVRTLSDADRIGAPMWEKKDRIGIDTGQPIVYTLLSHTRIGADILPQLNYIFWFPSRPKTGRFDLLGGHLDGLLWRVTLARDGAPLIYDTIHNCGCYHQFFPGARMHPREHPRGFEETAFVPQPAPELKPGERIQLGIDANTHFLFNVATVATPPNATRYVFDDYDRLRSMPHADGSRRGMFGPSGIVAGSERGERFLFWPMGIESAGAMRQWGRHATAFVGRRHFDEARLIERYFEFTE